MNSSNNRPNNQEGGSDKKPLMKYEFRTSGDIQEAFLNVTHAPSIGRSVAQAEGKLMSPHEVEIAAIKEDRLTQERATARREDIALIQTNTPAVKKLADFSTTFSGYKSVTTTMGGDQLINGGHRHLPPTRRPPL
jgi:hypothetical protein